MKKTTLLYALCIPALRKPFGLFLLALFSFTVHAQTVKISGVVKDEKGAVMEGVTVAVKGSTTKTISDASGKYTIAVPDSKATLIFSFIAFNNREVAVNGRTSIDIVLSSSDINMDDVVVVGYGTQTKRTVTGSIASMKAEEIEKYNVNSFQSALQGRMAGVEMYESSGVPGAAVNVRIRGLSSINGSAGPLYIIDGNPVFTGNSGDGDDPVTSGDNTGTRTNPLTDINPNDIESIEVLKDAAATSIYGARGGGGVILITTKRGKNGKTTFNVTATSGYNRIGKDVPLLNGPQLLGILDEAYKNTFYSNPANAGLPLPATPLPPVTGFNRGLADTTDINHFDEVLRTGIFRDINLSATNGTDKTKYYINAGVKQTIANIIGSEMLQFSLRANIDHDLSKYVRIGISLSPSYTKSNRLGSGEVVTLGGYGGALVSNLPIYPVYNADGTYFNPWTNPLAYQDKELYSNTESRIRLPISAYIEAKLWPSLTFRTMVQREDWDQKAPTYISGFLRLRTADNTNSISPFADDQLAMQKFTNSYGYSNTIQSVFTYTKTFAKQHNVGGTLGMNFSEANTLYEAMYGENFANHNFIYPSQAANLMNNFQTGADDNLAANLSYFARVNYQFKKRYLAGLVVNREGNSRFGGNKRFGTFPAASVGWIISDEKFLAKSKLISFLKLRASAGITGNSTGIGNQSALSTWSISANTSGYMGSAQLQPSMPANLNLHWEKGKKFDVGLDAGFLKGRITATIDGYHYTTTEMLLSIPTPLTFGYGGLSQELDFIENRGSLQNKGIELSINSTNFKKKDFSWRTTFNISHNETKILSLGGLKPETVSGGSGAVQLYEGRNGPVYTLIEFAGVDPLTGGELINGADGKTVLASTLNADQLAALRKPQFDKLPTPKFYGGIGNTFQYKAFELSAFFSYRYGNYLLDAGERQRSYVANINITNFATSGNIPNQPTVVSTINVGNLPTAILNRWTTPGQITDFPKLYYNDAANNNLRTLNTTRFLHDASFIRLKNVQLSYTMGKKLITRLGVKSARLSITGQNLFMLTKFPGADPEAISIASNNYRERNIGYGIIQNVVPQPKTLTISVNVGF